MPLKTVGPPLTVKEAIEFFEKRTDKVNKKTRKLLDAIVDPTTKEILINLLLMIELKTNTNILRILLNLHKIEDLSKVDEETRDLIKPILELIHEDKTPDFVV